MAYPNPRSGAFLCGSAALLFLWGCGYIGEPLPPLMNIPRRAENMVVIQRGSNIVVRFALPTLTTEGVVLKQDVRTEVRVGVKPAGQLNPATWAASAKPAGGGAAENGVAEYKIPSAEWTGKDVLIGIKVVGANGRDAGWSTSAALTVVLPPEQPRDLTAESAPQGVRLAWHGTGGSFAIFRRGPDEKDYKNLAQAEKPEWIDATVEFGKPYSYEVRALTKAGEGVAESELSKDAAVTPLDTFPPAVPTGLAAVPSTASIELVWERNTEPTLVGYRVYRALGDGPFERIADTQVLPSYSDRKLEAGKTYRYAVTAVKKNGMESKQSEPVAATAP